MDLRNLYGAYYCDECRKIMTKNCGHSAFGNKLRQRDLTPGKIYFCLRCNE